MSDDLDDIEPGLVIDSRDSDAKLITVRMAGPPHFTGLEMAEMSLHFGGRDLPDLTVMEVQLAAAYVYLRRAIGERATWDMAANRVTVEYANGVDPTAPASSET